MCRLTCRPISFIIKAGTTTRPSPIVRTRHWPTWNLTLLCVCGAELKLGCIFLAYLGQKSLGHNFVVAKTSVKLVCGRTICCGTLPKHSISFEKKLVFLTPCEGKTRSWPGVLDQVLMLLTWSSPIHNKSMATAAGTGTYLCCVEWNMGPI